MNPSENLFCKCLRLCLHPEETSLFSPEERARLPEHLPDCLALAEKHSLVSSLYESLCLLEIPLSPEDRKYSRQMVTGNALASYRMLAFTRKILHILQQEEIPYFLLKGATLLDCFPKLELRSFGDVDILIPDSEDFKRLRNRLTAQGFHSESSFAEHHLEMYDSADGWDFLLEIHHKVIARQANGAFNQNVQEIFQNLTPVPGSFPPANLSYQMLPATENALYLLLHMLQHFLGSGFGIRLLCDWTAYLEKHGTEIDWERFQTYLHQLGLTKFSTAVTQLCMQFLGLDACNFPCLSDASQDKNFPDIFMKEILDAGTFGKTNRSRMLIMSGGSKFSQYFIELHRQMKKRFQRLCKIPPLWPFLWITTCLCFLWNNHFLRKTKTKDILDTARKRQHLVKELTLFQKGGHDDEG